jgi:hypothetical protein
MSEIAKFSGLYFLGWAHSLFRTRGRLIHRRRWGFFGWAVQIFSDKTLPRGAVRTSASVFFFGTRHRAPELIHLNRNG